MDREKLVDRAARLVDEEAMTLTPAEAIAEAAREMVAVINAAEAAGNANPLMGDAARIRWHDRIVAAEQGLFAAVDAERAAQPSTRPNPQP